ncbi:MAG TPA: class E sortase [Solirubrobacteraceae bacterium]|jgi:sortase A|nr:class E sortase [Solirubrobacteraceae bacterium]
MRRALRSLSTVLIVSGSLMLADAALTLLWQEPVSGLYAKIVQGRLNTDLQKLQKQKTSPLDLAALRKLATEKLRIAFEARKLRGELKPGEAAGRITIAKIKVNYVVVDGTDTAALRKGPGIYEQVPFPGAPGTTAIAGHRTTWLAPFRRINELRRGDKIVVQMPYARLTYAVEMTRIVPPTELSVIHRVSHDRLVLSACHPLYSAAKRFIVFAKLVSEQALGAARI